LAEEIFHMPVRLGVPQNVTGLTDIVNNPIYATGVGLLKYGITHSSGGTNKSGKSSSEKFEGLLDKVKNWFKGNF